MLQISEKSFYPHLFKEKVASNRVFAYPFGFEVKIIKINVVISNKFASLAFNTKTQNESVQEFHEFL
jgi:hypothetical protein